MKQIIHFKTGGDGFIENNNYLFIKYVVMSKRKTTKEFITDAIKIHGEKYDYSNIEYPKNNKTKIYI